MEEFVEPRVVSKAQNCLQSLCLVMRASLHLAGNDETHDGEVDKSPFVNWKVRVFEPLPPRLNCFLRRGEGISNHRRRVSI